MYQLTKRFTFEAAHQLIEHDGKCARLHGHSWAAIVICAGEGLQRTGPKTGMLLDYGTISDAMRPLIERYLDHWHLNETLETEAPTSEFLAHWIFEALRGSPIGPWLRAVQIEETCTASAEYRPTEYPA